MSLKGIVAGYTNSALDEMGMLSVDKKKVADERFEICKNCPILDKNTNICQKDKGGCGCFMTKKVYAMNASCPTGRWQPVKK